MRKITPLYVFDLAGVAVFAVTGALAAGRAGLDLFGVVVVAAVTAIGGGTIRDLLLNRHPMFWICDQAYLAVIAAAALATVVYARTYPIPLDALLVADALGLALFALSGAQIAEGLGLHRGVAVLMGTMTGVGGGVVRDLLTGQVPLLLRKDIYATAAIAGIAFYFILQALKVKRSTAFVLGAITVAAIRLLAIRFGWQLPAFQLPG